MFGGGARRFMVSFTDQQPVVVFSLFLGLVGIGLPHVVVPIRETMGLPTYQYNPPIASSPIAEKK